MLRYLIHILGGRKDEALVGIFFDRKLKCVDVQILSYGNSQSVTVSTRRLFRTAIQCGATAFVLAHNHPSGNIQPSISDYQSTENARKIGGLIGIELIDHFIVSGKSVYSMAHSKTF